MMVCYTMVVLILIRCLRWLAGTDFVEMVFGLQVDEHMQGCLGLQCYEVFTCYGMRASTYHIREPLCSITGIVFFTMGAVACHHGYRDRLQILAAYLTCYAILQTVCVIGDIVYIYSCDAYSVSVVDGTLLSLFSRVLPAAQEQLRNMNYFPKPMVDNLTEGYETALFYIVRYGAWALFLLYAAWEAVLLGMLAERGPLGVGVHYGLDQWDESLSKEAIMHRRAKELPSPFIEDTKLATPKDIESPFGYYAGHGDYGTMSEAQKKQMGRMVGRGATLDEWSSHRRMHHASPEVVPKYATHFKRAEGKEPHEKRVEFEEDEEGEHAVFRSELDLGVIDGDAAVEPDELGGYSAEQVLPSVATPNAAYVPGMSIPPPSGQYSMQQVPVSAVSGSISPARSSAASGPCITEGRRLPSLPPAPPPAEPPTISSDMQMPVSQANPFSIRAGGGN